MLTRRDSLRAWGGNWKQLAELGADPFDLRYNVRFSVPFRDLKRRPDGWIHIANRTTRNWPSNT
jgi:hypothetical protein